MEDEDPDLVPNKFDLVKIQMETMPLHLLALRVADYAAAKDWQFAALASMALCKRSVSLTGFYVQQAEKEQARKGGDS